MPEVYNSPELAADDPDLPENAGPYAGALSRILQRIAPGWGRWISCDPGWFALLDRLDQELTAIAPEYELYQVKEKFGTLRYYVGLPTLQPECCTELARVDPRPCRGSVDPQWAPKDRTADQQAELEAWVARADAHAASAECSAAREELEPEQQARRELLTRMHKAIERYEEESARTCEACGSTDGAELRARRYWVKTVCSACGDRLGFVHSPDDGISE